LKCKVCSREVLTQTQHISKYCELHEKAYQNILQKFDAWRKASGIEWKEYLKEIVENPFSGKWAKEVAETLFKEEK